MKKYRITDVPASELDQLLSDLRLEGYDPEIHQQPDGAYIVEAIRANGDGDGNGGDGTGGNAGGGNGGNAGGPASTIERFVSARAPQPLQVIYRRSDGRELVREGGSRAWRNNNPGNIERGSFADEHDAIGGDTRFAIFPSEQTGLLAVGALLRSPSYRNLTLQAAINRYAPPSENNTAGYIGFVSSKTGIDAGDVLSTLNDSEIAKLCRSIQVIEGWNPGREYEAGARSSLVGVKPKEPVSSAAEAATDWMRVALTEEALPWTERSEWQDPGENPRILNYIRVAAPWYDPIKDGGDEVHWCASFVNYCLEQAGYHGTGHPGARSFFWNNENRFIFLAEPVYGCIAVFRDSPFVDVKWLTGTGHAGFITRWTDTQIEMLGGNQGNTVKREWYPKEWKKAGKVTRKLAGYYVPVMN
ncbi:TIGR02594 family protein [Methylobacterium sp. Leaf100]|uniref:TIGR02594 family protein n=1 Tax=Methylobacterium sp. Leaf100 TaxID=1736252 RepID=UPI0009EBB36A|nr:TIGR02594 family protein [Methylobacterium sp. Leaf100]